MYFYKKNKQYEIAYIAILFIVSVIIRYLISDFEKWFIVYPDEWRYFSIAESLAHGEGITIYNAPNSFQKIMYSLFIAPAFWVSDRLVTIKIISLINSCIVSSGIIASWFLAKKMLQSKVFQLLIPLVYVVVADMVYSMTFMSETLFAPLAIWGIYLVSLSMEDRDNLKYRYILYILCGIMFYALYFTKEVAVVFPIAYVATQICSLVYQRFFSESNQIEWSTKSFIHIFGPSIIFVLIHILMKMIFFRGVGNSYNQTSLDVIFKDGVPEYLFYSFVYYLCSAVVAFYIVPVVLPIMKFEYLSLNKKKYCIFLIWLVILTAGVVAYTISIREDFGTPFEQSPRAHLRYISYALIPFIIAMLASAEVKKKNTLASVGKAEILTIIIGLLFLVFWKGINDGSTMDQIIAEYWCHVPVEYLMTASIVLILFTMFCIFLFDRGRKVFMSLFLGVYFLTQILSNVYKIDEYQKYAISENGYESVCEVEQLLDNNADSNFVYLDRELGDSQRLVDTFLTKDNMYIVNTNTINQLQEIYTGADVKKLLSAISYYPYGLNQVDYLITSADPRIYPCNNILQKVLQNDYFIVYQLEDTSRLPFILNSDIIDLPEVIYTPEGFWPFYSNDPGKTTSTMAGMLVYGPYSVLKSGTYCIEVQYEYLDQAPSGTVVGQFDLFSANSNENWGQYKLDLLSDQNSIFMDNIVINTDAPQFEMRVYTHYPNVKINKIVIKQTGGTP